MCNVGNPTTLDYVRRTTNTPAISSSPIEFRYNVALHYSPNTEPYTEALH